MAGLDPQFQVPTIGAADPEQVQARMAAVSVMGTLLSLQLVEFASKDPVNVLAEYTEAVKKLADFLRLGTAIGKRTEPAK